MEEVDVMYSYGSRHSRLHAITDNKTLDKYKRIYEDLISEATLNGGFVYVKITKGQKANSIAKLVFDKIPEVNITISKKSSSRYHDYVPRNNTKVLEDGEDIAEVVLQNYQGNLKWDDKSNKPKARITDRDITWLQGYSGPTVWNVVSAKDMREEALQQPIYDLDNKLLNVGDNVLYINARYSRGMVLRHGIIDRFEAEYHSGDNTVSVYTIVVGDNQESKIASSKDFIFREV